MKQIILILLLAPVLCFAQSRTIRIPTGGIGIGGSGGTIPTAFADSVNARLAALSASVAKKADTVAGAVPYTESKDNILGSLNARPVFNPDSVRRVSQKIVASDIDPASTIQVSPSALTYSRPVSQLRGAGSQIIAQTEWGMLDITASRSLTDGRCDVVPVFLAVADTIRGAVTWVQTAGVYSGDNYNGIILFRLNAAAPGGIEVLASTANDVNLWATAGMAKVPFTTEVVAAPGNYYLGFLYNNSAQTTAPTLGAPTNSGTVVTRLDFTQRQLFFFNATAVPTSMGGVTISDSNVKAYGALYK